MFAKNYTNQIKFNYFNSHGEEAQEKPPGLYYLLYTTSIVNEQGPQRRILILILGFKGLTTKEFFSSESKNLFKNLNNLNLFKFHSCKNLFRLTRQNVGS